MPLRRLPLSLHTQVAALDIYLSHIDSLPHKHVVGHTHYLLRHLVKIAIGREQYRQVNNRAWQRQQLRTTDTQIEDMIVSSVKKNDQGSYLAMPPDVIQSIVAATNEEIDKIKDVIPTVIILTSPVVRIYFKKLTEQFIQNITVLSYSEIDASAQIQAIGNISLGSAARV